MSSVANRPRQFIRLSSHELTESGELIAVPENERVFGFLDPSKMPLYQNLWANSGSGSLPSA